MPDKRTLRRNVTRLAGAVFALLAVMGFVWFVQKMMAAKTGKTTRVVETMVVF